MWNEFITEMNEHDLFLYHGHGCCDKYISHTELSKTDIKCACFIMGCSSGLISHHYGSILSFLQVIII